MTMIEMHTMFYVLFMAAAVINSGSATMTFDQISVKDLNKAMRKVSKGPDIRQEMTLVTGVYANWEEFLVPGPICIAIMGDLMLRATRSDFTLDKHPPKNGFKLLKYPNSFRASLMQVVNEGYNAFNAAHKNMDNIRLRASKTTNQVKHAVHILLRGTNEELEQMLQIPLGNIKETADECLSLAQKVESKFQFVMDLTAELLEACVQTEGTNDEDIRVTEIALTIANESKREAEERKFIDKNNFEILKKSAKDAEKAYYAALDSMPSGWKLIGMQFVEGLSDIFTDTLGVLPKVTSAFVSALTKRSMTSNRLDSGRTNLPEADIEGYSLTSRIKPVIDNLLGNFAMTAAQGLLEMLDSITYGKKQLQTMLTDSKPYKGDVMGRVTKLCKMGIENCEKLENVSRQFQEDPAAVNGTVKRLRALQIELQSLSTEGKARMGSNPTDLKSPFLTAYEPEPNESATQQAVKNARFKVEQIAALLKNAQENYDNANVRQAESSKKLMEVIAEMKKLEIHHKSIKDVKQTLVEGIRALGELREKWGKIVMFFQMMSNIVEVSMHTTLKDFLKYSQITSEQTLKGYPITSLKRDMIYNQAFEAAKIAHLVTMISGSYVKVSQAHLMERIAGLGKLLAFDPVKDQYRIKRERLRLIEGCEQAQSQIRILVLRRKEEFDRQINTRMQAVRREIEAVVPANQDGDESNNSIREVVNKGIEKAEEAEAGSEKTTLGDDIAGHFVDI